MKRIIFVLAVLILSVAPLLAKDTKLETATFAGGCFWCLQHPYDTDNRIKSNTAGFAGGDLKHPSYKQVSSGKTKHREAVQITYDPKKITYKELLDIFWRQINATDDGGQFGDRGFQYTTAIFYHNKQQKAEAEKSKLAILKSGKFKGTIVTPIIEYKSFYKASESHQKYYKKNPIRYKLYYKASGRERYLKRLWGFDKHP